MGLPFVTTTVQTIAMLINLPPGAMFQRGSVEDLILGQVFQGCVFKMFRTSYSWQGLPGVCSGPLIPGRVFQESLYDQQRQKIACIAPLLLQRQGRLSSACRGTSEGVRWLENSPKACSYRLNTIQHETPSMGSLRRQREAKRVLLMHPQTKQTQFRMQESLKGFYEAEGALTTCSDKADSVQYEPPPLGSLRRHREVTTVLLRHAHIDLVQLEPPSIGQPQEVLGG